MKGLYKSLSLMLVALLSLSSIFIFTACNTNKTDNNQLIKKLPEVVADGVESGTQYAMPSRLAFITSTDQSVTASEGITLVASYEPSYATNIDMDWFVSFVDSSVQEQASTYISITPASNGSNIAVVKCLKPFSKQIKITVSARTNPAVKDECVLDYIAGEVFIEYLYSEYSSNESIAYVHSLPNHYGSIERDEGSFDPIPLDKMFNYYSTVDGDNGFRLNYTIDHKHNYTIKNPPISYELYFVYKDEVFNKLSSKYEGYTSKRISVDEALSEIAPKKNYKASESLSLFEMMYIMFPHLRAGFKQLGTYELDGINYVKFGLSPEYYDAYVEVVNYAFDNYSFVIEIKTISQYGDIESTNTIEHGFKKRLAYSMENIQLNEESIIFNGKEGQYV